MNHVSVYGLKTAESRIVYVGETAQPLNARLGGHVTAAVNGYSMMPVLDWIREVGPENVEIVLLEECNHTDNGVREAHWINELRTHLRDGGYNAQIPRAGRPSTHTDQARAGMSAAAQRRWNNSGSAEKEQAAERMRLSLHKRWHVNRGVRKEGCTFC